MQEPSTTLRKAWQIHVWLSVCVCVCVSLCTYVCMHARMYACMYAGMQVCTYARMYIGLRTSTCCASLHSYYIGTEGRNLRPQNNQSLRALLQKYRLWSHSMSARLRGKWSWSELVPCSHSPGYFGNLKCIYGCMYVYIYNGFLSRNLI